MAYKEDAAVQLVDKENAEAEDVDMAWVAYLAAVQILEEVPLLRVRILPLADVAHACASTAHRLLLFLSTSSFKFSTCGRKHRRLLFIFL